MSIVVDNIELKAQACHYSYKVGELGIHHLNGIENNAMAGIFLVLFK
jgi:hypothetical protein